MQILRAGSLDIPLTGRQVSQTLAIFYLLRLPPQLFPSQLRLQPLLLTFHVSDVDDGVSSLVAHQRLAQAFHELSSLLTW